MQMPARKALPEGKMPTVSEILETMDYGPAPESITEAREWADARGPV